MAAPRVSILTTFLNAEAFLAEAVESVLVQTFADWELLLVDDGSMDSSSRIAREYAVKHPARMFYIEHEAHANRGLTASRNVALKQSRGEFVALLDADDVWLPAKLSQQVEHMDAHPEAGMSYGLSEYWFDWQTPAAQENYIPELVAPNRMYTPPELAKLTYPLGPHGSPCPSDLIFRRDALVRVGGFEEEFAMCEDMAFLAKIFLNEPVYVSADVGSRYRRHADSMWAVAQDNGEEARSRAQFLVWLGKYFDAHQIVDEELWRLHRAAMRKWGNPRIQQVTRAARKVLRPLKRWLQ